MLTDDSQENAGRTAAPAVIRVGAKDKIFAASSVPMWVFDQQTLQFLEVNDAAVKRYGYTRRQFLSMSILDIRPLVECDHILRTTLDPRLQGPTTHEVWVHQKADGSTFYVDIYSEEFVFNERRAELVWASPLLSDLRREAGEKDPPG